MASVTALYQDFMTALQNLDINLILIGGVFLAFGLLTGRFVRRFLNVTFFVILIYVGMTILERSGLTPSWPLFEELRQHLVGTGKSTAQLFAQILSGASVLFSGLFLIGGIFGVFMGRR